MTAPRPAYSGPDLCALSARETIAALKARTVSPAELIDAALARVAQTGPAINAMVTLCEDRARRAAGTVDPASLLAGLPLGIKDVTPVKGVRTTWGTPAFADHVPDASHPLVERIEERGGVVIGKTNTPEMAAGANTFNPVFGATRNPWDTRLNAAGSSGGAAAGLATGEVWLSHGSDLGGSLRTPAAYCGIVGLRPSPGIAWGGPAANLFDTMPVQGPMARDVADCALFLDAMTGPHARAPLSRRPEQGGYLDACLAPAGPVRIAFAPDFGGLAPIETDMADALAAAMARLPAPDFAVEDTAPPTAGVDACFRTLRAFGFMVDALQTPDSVKRHYKPALQQNIAEGRALDTETLARAVGERTRIHNALTGFIAGFDVIVAPQAGLFPLPVEVEWPTEVAGTPCHDYLDWLRFAMPATLCGLPALCMPVGINATGLPIGIQLIGRPHGEARLLQVARAIEDALGLPKGPIDPNATHLG